MNVQHTLVSVLPPDGAPVPTELAGVALIDSKGVVLIGPLGRGGTGGGVVGIGPLDGDGVDLAAGAGGVGFEAASPGPSKNKTTNV